MKITGGQFITFEGCEGTGKSTQIKGVAERLRKEGLEVVLTKEPGGCPIADQIRAILLHPENEAITSRTELLLYAASRAQHVEEVVEPALARGAVVLCDRYTDSTIAYQGDGRGLDRNLIDSLNVIATAGRQPDMTVLLEMPLEEALGRAIGRNEEVANNEGRFEAEAVAFHARVKEGYEKLAEAHPERFCRVDAAGTPEQVAERVWATILENVA